MTAVDDDEDDGEDGGMHEARVEATTSDGTTVPCPDGTAVEPDDIERQILAITYDVAMASLHRVIAPSLVDFLS